jgi:hypothetical protein
VLPSRYGEVESVTLTVQFKGAATLQQWQSTWEGCPTSTYFHSPEWAKIWQLHTRGAVRPAPKLLRFSDGCEAIIPLCHQTKMRGLLNRYVSSPEATYGGWISTDALTTEHAVLLIDWMMKADGKNLVWRLNPYDPIAFEAAVECDLDVRRDETHAVRLQPDADKLFRGFKKGTREDIKKAKKRGCIEVSCASTEAEWKAYYRVYQDSLSRWGHNPDEGYDWGLFQTIFKLQSPHVKLWISRYEGQIVSGELTFYAKTHAVSWHAATLKDYLRSGVGKYQTFEIIMDCCARGYRWLDFNPSAGLDGVKGLKESFRAEVLPAPLVYVDTPLKRWIRKAAISLNVNDAKLNVEPLGASLPSPLIPSGQMPGVSPPGGRTRPMTSARS